MSSGNVVPIRKDGVCDPAHVRYALGVLYSAGLVVEVRAFGARTRSNARWRPAMFSGYFDNGGALADAVAEFVEAEAVYFTLNPVKPMLLSRAANRLIRADNKTPTTADHQILQRRWLYIDVDAARVAKVSATEEEHTAAMEMAERICAWLTEQGWPAPLLADSGNGGHLLYRIDLPNDDEATQLVMGVLEALGQRFDAPADAVKMAKAGDVVKPAPCSVDRTVCNASRICKLYGTRACKGDSTDDRPHRMSALLEVPEVVEVVDRALLEELAGQVVAQAKGGSGRQAQRSAREQKRRKPEVDLPEWLAKHMPGRAEGPKQWAGKDGTGKKWIFDVCPFVSDHTDTSAWVAEFNSGGIAAGCQHDSCRWGWKELRELYEPGCYDAKPLWGFVPVNREALNWLGAFAATHDAVDLVDADIQEAQREDFDWGVDVVERGGAVRRPDCVPRSMATRIVRRFKAAAGPKVEADPFAVVIEKLTRRPVLNRATFDVVVSFEGETAEMQRMVAAELMSYKMVRDRAFESGVLLPQPGKDTRNGWDAALKEALATMEVVQVDREESSQLAIVDVVRDFLLTADADGDDVPHLANGGVISTATGGLYVLPRRIVEKVRAVLAEDKPQRTEIVDAARSLGCVNVRPTLIDGKRPHVWHFPRIEGEE